MRCPKCRYIGFEDHDRCRNCGYDFSLIETEAPLDLPIRPDEPDGPMADLRLSTERRRSAAAALTPPMVEPERPARHGLRNDGRPGEGLTPGGFDLPLFNDARDDVPLVSANLPPRAPLAVRRAPAIMRPRVDEVVDLEPALEFAEPPEAEAAHRQHPDDTDRALGVVDTEAIASSGPRLLGAAIDALIVGGIDAAVLYFTLQLCGLPLAAIRALPVVPMLAFLLLLNGGYVTMFTAAGGQTIGKMLAGTRVVPAAPADGPRRLPFGTALIRAAACVVSLLPAGAGFFMAIVRADGRALHDAVADTRVIKA
jgi:uncharacterized RDD family membrane protein YckC